MNVRKLNDAIDGPERRLVVVAPVAAGDEGCPGIEFRVHPYCGDQGTGGRKSFQGIRQERQAAWKDGQPDQSLAAGCG